MPTFCSLSWVLQKIFLKKKSLGLFCSLLIVVNLSSEELSFGELALVIFVLFIFLWQSRADPREIMTEVLKTLRVLNVCWKRIGHYNMKCRWAAGILGHSQGMMNNHNLYLGDDSAIIEDDAVSKSNVIKFEMQVTLTVVSMCCVWIRKKCQQKKVF